MSNYILEVRDLAVVTGVSNYEIYDLEVVDISGAIEYRGWLTSTSKVGSTVVWL